MTILAKIIDENKSWKKIINFFMLEVSIDGKVCNSKYNYIVSEKKIKKFTVSKFR